jgi:hypothetical protein
MHTILQREVMLTTIHWGIERIATILLGVSNTRAAAVGEAIGNASCLLTTLQLGQKTLATRESRPWQKVSNEIPLYK